MAKLPTSMDELAEWLHRVTTANARQLFARLSAWFERVTADNSSHRISSPRRNYMVSHLIASGDVADIYAAVADQSRYVLKVCRADSGNSLLAVENVR